MGLTWNGTGLLLQGTTADTLAVPIVPVGVAGIRGDRTVLSQRGEVQVHRPLVVTLKILKSWVVKGMVKEGSSRLGWAAQLVRVLHGYAKVAGLIPHQGTYENQPMNV